MALMKFREENHVKWMGVRPGHDGAQVLERASANNGVTILYTVPAGSTFYLCHAWLDVDAVAAGSVNLSIYNDVPAIWRLLYVSSVPITTNRLIGEGSFFPPIELPAAYSIRVESTVLNCIARSFIYGWVE